MEELLKKNVSRVKLSVELDVLVILEQPIFIQL